MGIFKLLTQNLGHKPVTRRPDDPVPYPAGYRGMLAHNPDSCIACKICAYVCSPDAIDIVEQGQTSAVWDYFAEQCTFCGRCVDYCPTGALSFTGRAPAVTGDRSQHRLTHLVTYPLCKRCGQPMHPTAETMLADHIPGGMNQELTDLLNLCDRCRRKTVGERIKKSFENVR